MSANQLLEPGAPLAAPVQAATATATQWLRANLFAGWKNSLVTLAILALAVWLLPKLYRWGISDAVFVPDFLACRNLDNQAACWGVIAEKFRLIFFGRYPHAEQWRPLVGTAIMMATLVASCWRIFWRKWLVLLWVVVLTVFLLIMRGGVFAGQRVRHRQPRDARADDRDASHRLRSGGVTAKVSRRWKSVAKRPRGNQGGRREEINRPGISTGVSRRLRNENGVTGTGRGQGLRHAGLVNGRAVEFRRGERKEMRSVGERVVGHGITM